MSFKTHMPTMTFALTAVRKSHRSAREEGDGAYERQLGHKSVMLNEVLIALKPQAGEIVLDATVGQGGHSEALLNTTHGIQLIALDADPSAVVATRTRLASFGDAVQVVESNFADVEKTLDVLGIEKIDKALFDLGWRSEQLLMGRGFSFLNDEVLNMSYGPTPRSGFTAGEIVNQWSEETLANVFYGYGEERYARRIARLIIERRALSPITTTAQLTEIIKDAVPALYRRGRIHPATKSFQALRIAVNDELQAAEVGVNAVWQHLNPAGRIAVITFHSIEDRLVKRLFATWVKEGLGKLVYKKPLVPTIAEITNNPRARSAKLRVIEKL
jgi:16S rRNA (cytosine1402-N4)-methyltransferase